MKELNTIKFFELLGKAYATLSELRTLEYENDFNNFETATERDTGHIYYVNHWEETLSDERDYLKETLQELIEQLTLPEYSEDNIGDLVELADYFLNLELD